MPSVVVVARARRRATSCPPPRAASSGADRGPWGALVSRTATEMADRTSPGIRTPRDPHELVTWENNSRMGERVTVFCGIDWAERHHDVALVDEAGELLADQR